MYKIYINETPLFLQSANQVRAAQSERELVTRYPGKPKFLLNYADMLEKGKRFDAVTLYADDVEQLFLDFAAHYKIIEAAGGVVVNTDGKILLIFRRSFWDLPKGKIDAGETKEAAAVREVQEETGLQELKLDKLLGETYHTYKQEKTRILKRTYWYLMHTTETTLQPQTEEDIEQAVWVELKSFLQEEDRIYGNIRDVLALV
ncbi:MAG: NUDIX hydrolase [Saprospiraceae bacterium]